MDYLSTTQAAEKWGISERRVQRLCEDGRVDGAVRFSRVWAIPRDAQKPVDPRKNQGSKKIKVSNENQRK